MKEEIFSRGPYIWVLYNSISCQLAVTYELEDYYGGIFEDTTGRLVNDHEVSVVGWGVENGTNYWIVRNSWGSYWGEKGLFRLVRGKNNLGIERECTYNRILYLDMLFLEILGLMMREIRRFQPRSSELKETFGGTNSFKRPLVRETTQQRSSLWSRVLYLTNILRQKNYLKIGIGETSTESTIWVTLETNTSLYTVDHAGLTDPQVVWLIESIF